MLTGEVQLADMLKEFPTATELTDDRPLNEYFLLRRLFPVATAAMQRVLKRNLWRFPAFFTDVQS